MEVARHKEFSPWKRREKVKWRGEERAVSVASGTMVSSYLSPFGKQISFAQLVKQSRLQFPNNPLGGAQKSLSFSGVVPNGGGAKTRSEHNNNCAS